MDGHGPKVVALLMVLAVAATVVPIMNVVEATKVQGVLNDYLTQQNAHILYDKKQIEDYFYDTIEPIVGEGADMEVIMYAYQSTVPTDVVEDPSRIPNLPGIKKSAGYYEVSALIVRVYWVQKKLVADKFSDDGVPMGKCFYCEKDALAERILFVQREKLGDAYRPPTSDLEFVRDPWLLFEQFE